MLIKQIKWQEFHPNGQLWIDGEIGIVGEIWKHLYDYRTGFKGYEGQPVCRIGIWKKYFSNGQLAWTIDYGTGALDCKGKQSFDSYRPNGIRIP